MTIEDKVWWGFEDDKLFAWAREEITDLSNQEEPFNIIIHTVDTHFVDGYLSQYAENKFDTQYENVHAYSSKLISDFVKWVQEQDFYDNTTIVIVGDHLGMQSEFYKAHIEEDYERTVYNVIINSAIEGTNTTNRQFSTIDMFPTILASIQTRTKTKVTVFFLAFLVIRVTSVFKNPLFSITPIPIKIIIKIIGKRKINETKRITSPSRVI